jgi:hypothetical protein
LAAPTLAQDSAPEASGALELRLLGTYASGVYAEGAAENVAHHSGTQTLYRVDGYESPIRDHRENENVTLGNFSALRNDICGIGYRCQLGDFNGDGRSDVVAFTAQAYPDNLSIALVSLSNGDGFETPTVWSDGFCIWEQVCDVGDFNGDGRDDIIAFTPLTGLVWVSLSTGTRFDPPTIWHNFFCIRNGAYFEQCEVGDFNGDGKDDILLFKGNTDVPPRRGNVIVSLSNGSRFIEPPTTLWHGYFCVDFATESCFVGDVNGDGKSDIILSKMTGVDYLGNTTYDVLVSLSDGNRFFDSSPFVWGNFYLHSSSIFIDVNNDNKDDAVRLYWTGDDNVSDIGINFSNERSFSPTQIWETIQTQDILQFDLGDINGDDKPEIVLFHEDITNYTSMIEIISSYEEPVILQQPPTQNIGYSTIYIRNCHVHLHTIHIWTELSNRPGEYLYIDEIPHQYYDNHLCANDSGIPPFELELQDGVWTQIIIVDPEEDVCGENNAYRGNCWYRNWFFWGDANGVEALIQVE